MHYSASYLVAALAAAPFILAAPSAAVTVIGPPSDDVSCPVPLTIGTFQHFTKGYVKQNIISIVGFGKKGSYPKPFNPASPQANQFNWNLNGCQQALDTGATILELPMYLDGSGNEVYWADNPASNNNKPGPYREYYILDTAANTATYCGAYAHKDLSSNGDFVSCG